MKKHLSLAVCIALVMTVLCTLTLTASAYDFTIFRQSDFNSGFYDIGSGGIYQTYFQFAKNSASTVKTEPYQRGDGDRSAKITVTGSDISEGNAPALQWALCNGGSSPVSGKSVTLSFDVNILSYDISANDAANVFGIAARSSGGWFIGVGKNTSFAADNSIGSFGWETNHWYNYEMTIDLKNGKRISKITDLQTNTVTILDGFTDLPSNAEDLTIVNFEMYCPGEVLIDNTVIKEAASFSIYSPQSNAKLDINEIRSSFGVPTYCTSAQLYLDGVLAENITPKDGIIQSTALEVSEMGEHILTLTGTGEGRSFYDEVVFTATAKEKQTVKDFAFNVSEWWIGQPGGLNGGVAGYSHTTAQGVETVDAKEYNYNTFTFTAQDAGNNPIFVRYGNALSGTEFDVSVTFKAAQTNEKFSIQVEKFGWFDFTDANGCFSGTETPYEANKWYTAKIHFNCDGSYTTYIDNNKLESGNKNSVSSLGGVRIYMYGNNNANSAFSLAKFLVESYSSLPNAVSIKSVKNGSESTELIADADSIKVTFDGGVDISDTAVSLVSDGVKIAAGTPEYDETTKTVSIPLEKELPLCAPINIEFSGLKTAEGISFGLPLVLRRTTGPASETRYGQIGVNYIGTTASGAVDVYAVQPGDAVIMIVGYSGNKMTSVLTKTVTLEYGKNTVSISNEDTEGKVFKCFLWSSLDDMTPLTESAISE